MSVTVRLADDLDVSRGQVIARAPSPRAVVRELVADVCWFDDRPLRAGGRYVLKAGTRTTRATVAGSSTRSTSTRSGATRPRPRWSSTTSGGCACAPPSRWRWTLRGEPLDGRVHPHRRAHERDGGGRDGRRAGRRRAGAPRSENVVRHIAAVTREQRWAALGRRGGTVWLTGLPSSGKSTIASALEALLIGRGAPPTCSTATRCATA